MVGAWDVVASVAVPVERNARVSKEWRNMAPGGEGGYSHIWAIQGCAAQQGIVFASLSLKQGLQISIFSFCNSTGYTFCHSDSGAQPGLLFRCQNRAANEHCCCLPLLSCCMFTQTIRRSTASHIFQSKTGYLFHRYVWNRVAKLCRFSLEQGQVPRHSAAHPHPKTRGVSPLEYGTVVLGLIWWLSSLGWWTRTRSEELNQEGTGLK